jgi:hypothetical protein
MSPPAAAPPAQPTGASAGKAVVRDDEFSLAKVRGPGSLCFSEHGRSTLAVVAPSDLSCPLVLNRWSFAGVLRCHRAGGWDLTPVVSSEFFSSLVSLRDSDFRMLCGGDHVLLHLRYGFGSYFNLLPGSEWSALLLTYGFPLTIIGMALKARTLSLCTCTIVLDITGRRL